MSFDNVGHRFDSADLFKGIGIVCIVFIHIMMQSESLPGADAANSFSSNPLFEFGYSGLVIFFLLSGYFYKPGSGCMNNILKRIIQIVPPFLICGVVLTLIMAFYGTFFGYVPDFDEIVKCIVNAITTNAFLEPTQIVDAFPQISLGYYFLIALLSGTVVFCIIADRVLKDWKHTIATIVILLVITAGINAVTTMNLPLRFQTAPFVAAMMLTGALMKKYDVLSFLENGWKTKKYWLIIIPIAAIGILFAVFFPSTLQFSENVFGENGAWSVFTYYILTVTCGYVLLAICGILCKIKPITKLFKTISIYSMFILLLHTFYIKLLATPFFGIATTKYFPYMDIGSKIIIAILSIVLSMLTTYVTYKIYNKIKKSILTKHESHIRE